MLANHNTVAAGISRKPSRALKIWLAVVASVLFALWLETSQSRHQSFNLFLSGDSAAVGAEVIVDGGLAGKMSSSDGTGMGGAIFYGRVGDGGHTIEVRKKGFAPLVKNIDLHGEDYLSVDLKPSSL